MASTGATPGRERVAWWSIALALLVALAFVAYTYVGTLVLGLVVGFAWTVLPELVRGEPLTADATAPAPTGLEAGDAEGVVPDDGAARGDEARSDVADDAESPASANGAGDPVGEQSDDAPDEPTMD
jgi:hypothetical protein